jgi:RNA polymerase sigma factor (sigma-70 family)
VEQKFSQIEEDADHDLIGRRVKLANVYQALPEFGSIEFWRVVEEPNLKAALPLKVLVRCFRLGIALEDEAGRNRIMEMIFRRTQSSNEYWSRQVLSRIHLTSEERSMSAHDLYADLCERVIHAILDSKRQFWEENFQHCLCFERKHVYQAFMTREGRWYHQPVQHCNGELWEMEIVDEQAQQALLSVEQHNLPLLILNLPDKLKPVIWLIFWEGRTEKNVAHILGVSDRTVRNRLQKALSLLRTGIELEGKTIYG